MDWYGGDIILNTDTQWILLTLFNSADYVDGSSRPGSFLDHVHRTLTNFQATSSLGGVRSVRTQSLFSSSGGCDKCAFLGSEKNNDPRSLNKPTNSGKFWRSIKTTTQDECLRFMWLLWAGLKNHIFREILGLNFLCFFPSENDFTFASPRLHLVWQPTLSFIGWLWIMCLKRNFSQRAPTHKKY